MATGSPSRKRKRNPVTDSPGFVHFWESYPRKEGKGAARRAWAAIKPGPDLTERILEAVERQRDWPVWREDGGRFIPHPATWLNQERWTDEGGANRGRQSDDDELIPSGAMTVGEWKKIKASLRKPIPPVFPIEEEPMGNCDHHLGRQRCRARASQRLIAPDGHPVGEYCDDHAEARPRLPRAHPRLRLDP